MGKTVQPTASLSVAFSCKFCGKSIAVEASGSGEQIPDAKAFLETHAECLRRIRRLSGRPTGVDRSLP
jgi:hypothetical protein